MTENDVSVGKNYGLRDAMTLVRGHSPFSKLYLGVYRAVSRVVIPESRDLSFAAFGDLGRVFVNVKTRFTEMDGHRVPLELRYLTLSCAPDRQTALEYLYVTSSRFHTLLQLGTNAGADVIHETLVQEMPEGSDLSWYRQTHFESPRLPQNGRAPDQDAIGKLINAAWGLPEDERDRVERAAVQYETALGHWRPGGRPMALAHVFMGVEALVDAVIRHKCRIGSFKKDELMRQLGVSNESDLHAAVRRQIIFQGDQSTHRLAKAASDGIEHGFASWESIWRDTQASYDAAARYLRKAIISLLGLDTATIEVLCGPRFREVVEEGDRPSMTGFTNAGVAWWKDTDFRITLATPSVKTVDSNETEGTVRCEFGWRDG
jgi:hypothetical protein